MEKNTYYKYLFLIAALWNIIISILLVLILMISPNSAKLFGVAVPPSFIWAYSFFFFVFLFGLLFYLTSRNLEIYQKLANIYVVEKVGIFLIFLIYLILGDINFLGFSLSIGDLIFGILFLEFSINYK